MQISYILMILNFHHIAIQTVSATIQTVSANLGLPTVRDFFEKQKVSFIFQRIQSGLENYMALVGGSKVYRPTLRDISKNAVGPLIHNMEMWAGERAGGAGIVGWGEGWRSCNCWLGRELAELVMLAGERAGRAGIITRGESWRIWNHYQGRGLAELESLPGERAGGAGIVGWGESWWSWFCWRVGHVGW